jgi:hypothetical protein
MTTPTASRALSRRGSRPSRGTTGAACNVLKE